ncbi:MAG TPA: efflux transporter outer membrane subunit [Gemmatimonadales bacterium]|nr:efflux transporter outer membrane subunit [Gemmatimonadales bacterium]
MRRHHRSIALALLLSGCALGPGYERPTTIVPPAAWRDSAMALRDSSYANLPWWSVLGDTTLQGLVRTALRENRDLHIALARVNEARALLGIQRLEFYPQINVGAGVSRIEGADSLLRGLGEGETFAVGASLSWEIDLWGRLRRLNEAARATLLASEQGRRGVILTVVSEVARAYLELLDLDGQVAIAETQVAIRRQSLELARARFEGGLTSELDVRQGENALAVAEGTRFRALRQRSQKENELSVLLGRPPGDLPRGQPLAAQQFPDVIPAGLPAELLERRPDVRQAEEQLHAANARIGAAIAALFPTISLTAAGGTVSNDLDNLFSGGTGFWNLAANLFQPILNSGRNRKQVAAERARTEAAVGLYEKAVLTAFREVEDGLVAVERLREEAAAAGRAAEAARLAVALASLRYEGGVDNYLNLLDAQRTQLDSELQESALQRQHRVAVVQLYKALGGGWDPVTDTLAMPAREGR